MSFVPGIGAVQTRAFHRSHRSNDKGGIAACELMSQHLDVGFPGCDSARLAGANVEVGRRNPFFAIFFKTRDKNRLLCLFV
jgi:hypothetical protein